MNFPPSNYDGLNQVHPQGLPVYPGQSCIPGGDFDTTGSNVDIDFWVEPLQDVAPWRHSSLQRFLKTAERPLFNPMPQSQFLGPAQPVAPIPPAASHGRLGSPFSSNEPSSCSGAQSPPVENEIYTDNIPSTPDNTVALFEPYQPPLYETFDVPDQFLLDGTGYRPDENQHGVSMVEVNPAEEIQTGWEDSAPLVDFSLPQRSFTYGSQASESTDMGAMSPQEAADHGFERMASPAEDATVIKDEIQIPNQCALTESAHNIYPTPSVGESEDYSEVEINVMLPQSDDDDDDYRPDNKRVPTQSSRRASRPKREAPRKPLDGDIPKRARMTTSASKPAKVLPPPTSGGKGSFACPVCSYTFNNEGNLQVHIKKQHTRPFICVFRFAGCDSTFASKNEWKRHVMSQHLLLHYWLCDLDGCADNKNDNLAALPASGKRNRGTAGRRVDNTSTDAEPLGPPLPDGAIFNRKDLYTQHLRRMHTPPKTKNAHPAKPAAKKTHASSPQTASPSGWDDRIKILQSEAQRERCQLPVFMQCPATCCPLTFSGADSWDQRMEHVAKHLESAAGGEEEPVVFGGLSDPSLMAWATMPEVAVVRAHGPGRWVLNNPLRSAGESRGAGRKRAASSASASTPPVVCARSGPSSPAAGSVKSEIVVDSGDEDAEGEEE
ncbi:hypothetical protein SLS53_003382 [Cytospora paraplurivora]|uniref:C2H2-type domain-containing protein n=1 Tax=Cytospora paraplurivora TaxID=2898453 RepID=A0AAN9YH03_9PEZI